MTTTLQTLLEVPPGFRSDAVGRFMWQLDEQRRRLLADTRELSVEALAWQPAPGMNSIGMLLAHIAYAESHLTQVGLEGKPTSDTKAAIGISEEEEGMPLVEGAAPSPALAGRDLTWFDQRLARARNHTREVALALSDADLLREVRRQRPDGTQRVFNVGWVLYHLLEHEAGHHGQINLLRHLQRVSGFVGP
ncbi:MAG TPA: DinB family protein [Candidatus Eisenbacteria bacterium]|nr:DinB family protein [Candidatus Eisenbacteria bacterium]